MAMVATGSAAAVPFGYDQFPLDNDNDEPFDFSQGSAFLDPLPGSSSMVTSFNFPYEGSIPPQGGFFVNAPEEPHQNSPSTPASSSNASGVVVNAPSPTDRAPQPLDTRVVLGAQSLIAHNAGSISPGTASTSIILTPASSQLEYHSSGSDSADARDSWSPSSATNDPFGGGGAQQGDSLRPVYTVAAAATNGDQPSAFAVPEGQMFRPPPQASSAPGAVAPSTLASPASVLALPSAAPNTTASLSSNAATWGSFAAAPESEWMDPSQHRHSDGHAMPSTYAYYEDDLFTGVTRESEQLLPNADEFRHVEGEIPQYHHPLQHSNDAYAHNPYVQGAALYPFDQYPPAPSGPSTVWEQQRQPDHSMGHQMAHHHQIQGDYTLPGSLTTDFQHHDASTSSQTSFGSGPAAMQQNVMESAIPSSSRHPAAYTTSDRASPYGQPSQKGSVSSEAREKRNRQTSAHASSSPRVTRPASKQKAPSVVPSNAHSRTVESKAGKHGGRPKGVHLSERTRQKSNQMRKIAACWRCAMQRDSCEPGEPCSRCLMRQQKGQTYFFDCDRSKLPDFVHEFLPASMTWMHQKQTIEDTVSEQVVLWNRDSPIDVALTSGYGPPLKWRVYEFKPKTDEYIGQLQYFQDPATGRSTPTFKYSPPLALLKLDASDDSHFAEYLDQLLEPEYLSVFGCHFFAEEKQVDEDGFQAQVLQFMCDLYSNTNDDNLRSVLNQVLRMLVVTFIMGHTLTFEEGTLGTVLGSLKGAPPPSQLTDFISPRLANRQLKFFFSVLRASIYEKLLHWQQQTLHTSGKRDASWLPAFCAMLGFAMMLEEVQRLLMVQADSKILKKEASVEAATTEARNACERIDARFKLLVGLFQCKYRDRTWGANGSFGPNTPLLKDAAAHQGLQELRELVVEKASHLESRRDVEYAQEFQCQYTSRLVARFLLPFLNLAS